ncbi:MAG: hypothetical protein EXQ97_01610 [Alphaproteobacteria bacterium]|nr:hypothetical protein [Alphaproteobacteria bacterium]
MLQRRDVLKAMAAVPAAGLPLAVVLANPELARAQAATLETVTITVGGKLVIGALASRRRLRPARFWRSTNGGAPTTR